MENHNEKRANDYYRGDPNKSSNYGNSRDQTFGNSNVTTNQDFSQPPSDRSPQDNQYKPSSMKSTPLPPPPPLDRAKTLSVWGKVASPSLRKQKDNSTRNYPQKPLGNISDSHTSPNPPNNYEHQENALKNNCDITQRPHELDRYNQDRDLYNDKRYENSRNDERIYNERKRDNFSDRLDRLDDRRDASQINQTNNPVQQSEQPHREQLYPIPQQTPPDYINPNPAPNSNNYNSSVKNNNIDDNGNNNNIDIDNNNVDNNIIDDNKTDKNRTDDNRTDKKSLDSHRIDSHRIDSNRIDSHRIDSHRIDSHRIDSNRIDSNRIDSNRIDSNRIDSHRIDSHRIDKKSFDKKNIDISRTDSNRIEKNNFDKNNINKNGDNNRINNKSLDNNFDPPPPLPSAEPDDSPSHGSASPNSAYVSSSSNIKLKDIEIVATIVPAQEIEMPQLLAISQPRSQPHPDKPVSEVGIVPKGREEGSLFRPPNKPKKEKAVMNMLVSSQIPYNFKKKSKQNDLVPKSLIKKNEIGFGMIINNIAKNNNNDSNNKDNKNSKYNNDANDNRSSKNNKNINININDKKEINDINGSKDKTRKHVYSQKPLPIDPNESVEDKYFRLNIYDSSTDRLITKSRRVVPPELPQHFVNILTELKVDDVLDLEDWMDHPDPLIDEICEFENTLLGPNLPFSDFLITEGDNEWFYNSDPLTGEMVPTEEEKFRNLEKKYNLGDIGQIVRQQRMDSIKEKEEALSQMHNDLD